MPNNLDANFKSKVRMHEANSNQIIILQAIGFVSVQSLIRKGFIDVKCYYLHYFITLLLLQVSLIKATCQSKLFISQDMWTFFPPNEVVLDRYFKIWLIYFTMPNNFNTKFKSKVRMHEATSTQIITLQVVGFMSVQSLVRKGYIDVKCYYLHYFITLLLLQVSVIKATCQSKLFIS